MKNRNKEIKAAIQSSCEATEKPKNELSSLKKEMGFPTAQNPTIADYQKRSQRRKWTLVAVSSFAVVAAVGGGLAGYYLSGNQGLSNTVLASKLSEGAVRYYATNRDKIALNSILLSQDQIQSATENKLVSPIGYSLCLAGYAQASGETDALIASLGFDVSSFSADLGSLMASLNWYDQSKGTSVDKDSKIVTLILDQIVDGTGAITFNKDYQNQIASDYVSTQESTPKTFLADAQKAIEKTLGMSVKMPPVDMGDMGVVIYSALGLKDSANLTHNTNSLSFRGLQGTQDVKDYSFSGLDLSYYEGSNYQAVTFPISYTDMTIILPKDGYTLQDVDMGRAYQEFKEKSAKTAVACQVPYFSLDSVNNLTEKTATLIQGTTPVSRLVTTVQELSLASCFQSNRFVFSENGVEGTSVTAMSVTTTAAPDKKTYIPFKADHPFYAVSSYMEVPLFSMAITDIA